MHGLVRSEHTRQSPTHEPGHGRRAGAQRSGSLGVCREALHLAIGEGRALPTRAPHERQLLERA
eukprot:13013180-Alexandrium_andersonii.AAC.1